MAQIEENSDHIFKSMFFSICVQNLLCLHKIDYIKDFSRPSSGEDLLEERIDDNSLPNWYNLLLHRRIV